MPATCRANVHLTGNAGRPVCVCMSPTKRQDQDTRTDRRSCVPPEAKGAPSWLTLRTTCRICHHLNCADQSKKVVKDFTIVVHLTRLARFLAWLTDVDSGIQGLQCQDNTRPSVRDQTWATKDDLCVSLTKHAAGQVHCSAMPAQHVSLRLEAVSRQICGFLDSVDRAPSSYSHSKSQLSQQTHHAKRQIHQRTPYPFPTPATQHHRRHNAFRLPR